MPSAMTALSRSPRATADVKRGTVRVETELSANPMILLKIDGSHYRACYHAPRFRSTGSLMTPPRHSRLIILGSGPAGYSAAVYADRKSTRLNSSHEWISYAVFCLKKKTHT